MSTDSIPTRQKAGSHSRAHTGACHAQQQNIIAVCILVQVGWNCMYACIEEMKVLQWHQYTS